MNTKFSYDRMDYYNILDYLKEQASYFSDGTWTDFSDADIGTVILKLIAMNADTTNYQVEKGISELYLDTVIERTNAIALCKLIGYEPRHYMSAFAELSLSYNTASFDEVYIEAFTGFSSSSGNISYYNLDDINIKTGENYFNVYEGKPKSLTFSYSDIDDRGRLILPDYNIGVNTIRVKQANLFLDQTSNALYGEGEVCFSVHISLDNELYIQLPTYYSNFLSQNAPIEVKYLITSGEDGRIGAHILDGTVTLSDGTSIYCANEYSSEGGYNPESIEEIRKTAPSYASTMNTLVTLDDFRILAQDDEALSDVMALDYNYPESGLIQPDEEGHVNDAYKVNLYILPANSNSIYKELEETDFDQMERLSLDDFIYSNDETYPWDYDEDTRIFTSTNHDSDSFSNLILQTKVKYKYLFIKYDISSEERFDRFYVDYNMTTIIDDSGEVNNYVEIGEAEADSLLMFSYVKDSELSEGEDRVKFCIYGIDEEAATTTIIKYNEEIESYKAEVKKKKPAGILVYYKDVEYIRPRIVIKIYMDEDDLRYNTADESVIQYLTDLYSRKYRKIGEPLYQSHISKDILSKFDYINYLEITELEGAVDGAIKPNRTQFVELIRDKIIVKIIPYES